MAYMSQDNKKQLSPGIKKVLKKYGMKGSIGVRHHSELYVTLKSGAIDFNLGDKTSQNVNPYHIDNHYEGTAKRFLNDLKEAMMIGNHNESDSQTDYFNVGWYIDIGIGRWDKPYQITSH